MDLEDWEFLSGNGFHSSGQELCFNPTGFFDVNYFTSPSPAMQEGPILRSIGRHQVLAAIDADPIVEKNPDDVPVKEIVEDCSVPPVPVAEGDVIFEIVFEELNENKSNTGVIMMPQLGEGLIQFAENNEPYMAEHLEQEIPKHATFSELEIENEDFHGLEIKGKACQDGSSFRWRMTGLRALCSIGMAAATFLMLVLAGNHQQKQPKLKFQMKSNEKRPRDALETFVNTVNQEFAPNNFTFGSVLRPCSECGELRIGEQLYGSIVKMGLLENEFIASGLISMYSKRKGLSTAMEVLRRMQENDAFTWTTMIVSCSNGGSPLEAFDLFAELLEKDMRPTAYAFTSVLKSCASLESLTEGAQVHGYVIKTGFDRDSSVRTSLVDLYAKFGDLCSARLIYDRSPCRDVVMYTVMIGGYAWNGSAEQAFEIFELMRGESGIHPYEFTFANIITSAAQSGELDLGLGSHGLVVKTGHALVVRVEGAMDQLRGKQIHAQIIKLGHESDKCVAGALVDMYAKSGSIEDAHQVFENLSTKDRIAWTAMIDGYAQHGQGRKTLDLLNQMIAAGIEPNGIAFISILNACSHSGLVREGLCLLRLMSSAYGIQPVLNHYACVVDFLGRAGRPEEAFRFIIIMPMEQNPTIWGSLLGACRNHKNLKLGIAERLLDLEPEDDATYVLLANMYASAGCWNKAFEVQHAMKQKSWLEVGNSFHVFGSSDSSHPQKEENIQCTGISDV
ncbi:hypothetical protein COCNU_scaffold000148G000030 [Cocos nucifera]|nr:hypothetical protein [Cocos nucifera]